MSKVSHVRWRFLAAVCHTEIPVGYAREKKPQWLRLFSEPCSISSISSRINLKHHIRDCGCRGWVGVWWKEQRVKIRHSQTAAVFWAWFYHHLSPQGSMPLEVSETFHYILLLCSLSFIRTLFSLNFANIQHTHETFATFKNASLLRLNF